MLARSARNGRAIEPDVEQPVVFVGRFFGRAVEQVLAGLVLPLEAHLRFERACLIKPQRRDVGEFERR